MTLTTRHVTEGQTDGRALTLDDDAVLGLALEVLALVVLVRRRRVHAAATSTHQLRRRRHQVRARVV